MNHSIRKPDDSLSYRGGTIPGTLKAAFSLAFPADMPIPVLVAVPHAGRIYPDYVWQSMRRPAWSALRLEDRFADRIAYAIAHATGAGLLVAHAPRAIIDLNRDQGDVDWSMVREGAPLGRRVPVGNGRSRNGLGLVPRRLQGLGEIWKTALTGSDLDARISQIHTPYHRAVERALAHCARQWGAALLIDLHSMPPLPLNRVRADRVEYVIGDRFGASACDMLVKNALNHLSRAGANAAYNRPYAGGYVLDRHADKAKNIHAVQIEICRSLYLDDDLDRPTHNVSNVARQLVDLVRILAQQVAGMGRGSRLPVAAE